MARKAAMELSTTVIVTLIISIIVITFGFILVFNVIDFGNQRIDDTLEATQLELEKYLSSDKKFFIYNSDQDGKLDQNTIFGLGVINRIETADFKIKIQYEFYGEDDNLIVLSNHPTIGPDYDEEPDGQSKIIGQIEKNVGKTSLLQVTPNDGTKGKYFFNIYVCTKSIGDDVNNGICSGIYKYKYAVGQATLTI